jgi:phospholipid/cholesterol/gamma-HCH transport system permease protein
MSFSILENRILIQNKLNKSNAKALIEVIRHYLRQYKDDTLEIDATDLQSIDSAGVATLDEIVDLGKNKGVTIQITNLPPQIENAIKTFSSARLESTVSIPKPKFLEKLGENSLNFWKGLKEFLLLAADTFYWGVAGIFYKKGQRKGEFIRQSVLIGVGSLPIVIVLAFLVGVIIALQSAQQLRLIGMNILVVDLLAIAMLKEIGPLMTAVILAGRSGSAIASEIATMKISEEIDALKTMALNPIKYVVLPKLYAITICTPLLAIFTDVVGILGGFFLCTTYLDMSAEAFIREISNVMIMQDLITTFVKSIVFSWLILLSAVFFGFSAEGGAEDVGRATTSAVVTAISLVIIADVLLGLIFY